MKKKQAQKRTDALVLTDLFSQEVTIEGMKMTMRQGMLLALSNQSLAGNMDAAAELQKLRDECGITDSAAEVGYLVVPEVAADEFERMVYEQQARFRHADYASAGSSD